LASNPGEAHENDVTEDYAGFLIDETYEELGKGFQVPPQFEGQRDFLMSYLEPLSYA